MRGGVDEDEDTVAVEIALSDLARMADDNALPDTKTLRAVADPAAAPARFVSDLSGLE